MKRLLALILTFAIVLSVVPANVLAAPGEIVNVTLEDTYVYDFMRESDGKFQGYETKGIITYSDGSTEEEYIYLFSNVDCTTGYGDFFCTDSQNEALWEVGNTYQVQYGDGKSFNVEVREAPISRVEFEDCELCYWDEEAERYSYRTAYTVYFPDGSSERYTSDFTYEYLDGGYWTLPQFTDTQDTTPWTVGGTYEATGTLLGISDTFNVTVTTVTDIQVQDVVRIENCDMYMQGHRDENDNWVDDSWGEYDACPEYATVTLSDGTDISGMLGEIQEYFGDVYWFDWYTGQSYENQWGVGEHTATLQFAGYEADYKVIVAETPVERIEIQDVTLVEGAKNYEEDGYAMYDLPALTATVTFKDGSTEVVENFLYYNDRDYCFDHNAFILQKQEPWTVGTYEVTGTILGASDTFNVTIEKSPIKSLEIQDVTIVEGTHLERYDGGYYYYLPSLEAKVTYQDGSTEEIYGELYYQDVWYFISTNVWDLQNEEAWGVGTYQATGSLLGVSDTFNVTIEPTPIQRMEIHDMEMFEGDCYEGYNRQDIYEPQVSGTVTFKDGRVEEFYNGIEYNDGYYSVETNAEELQYENPWTLGGTYEVTGTAMGISDTFKVTIVESPIESIEVQDLNLIEGLEAEKYDDYFHYYPQINVKVTFKDGTVQYVQDEVEINGEYYWIRDNIYEVQYEEPWTVGNTYQATATVLGVSDTFNITILENPIAEVQLVKQPVKTSYFDAEIFDLKGATIRLCYKDGTFEDVTIKGSPVDRYHIYSEKLDAYDTIYPCDIVELGDTVRVYELFGRIFQIPVTVKKNPVESISIHETANKTLVITVKNTDKTSYQMTLIDYINTWYGSTLVTDKGIFRGYLNILESGGVAVNLYNPNTDERMESNILANSQWIEAFGKTNEIASAFAMFNADNTVQYSGTITAQNIDAVIELAAMVYFDDENYVVSENENFCIVRAEGIRRALKALLGNVTVDLKLSKQYDAKADTYQYVYKDQANLTKLYPSQLTYTGGGWTANFVAHKADDKTAKPIVIDLKLNNNYQLVSISIGGENASIFKDISTTSWQFSAAKYAVENNLMAGKGTDAQGNIVFDPNSSITREEFVQVLYNAESKPSVSIANRFPDVGNSAWYKNAVLWANQNNIANGQGDGKFGVGKNITRQDLAMMLYKYAKLKGYTLAANAGEIDKYADGSKVSGYAKTAMDWAVTNGVLGGKGVKGEPLSKFKLDPAGTATRAECAAMLKNFMTAFAK